MSRGHQASEPHRGRAAVSRLPGRDRAALGQWVDWTSLADPGADVRRSSSWASRSASTGCSRTVRSRPTNRCEYALAILGSMAVAGPGHELGRRSPQAPRAHRPGGRPAHAPRPRQRRQGRGRRPLVRAHGLAVRALGHDASTSATPATSTRTAACSSSTRPSPVWVALGIAIPAALGLAITGTWRGALEAALWGGAVRIFLGHHVTWSINSVCHFFGTPALRRRGSLDQRLLARRRSRWASPGTTTTTRSRARPSTACSSWEIDPTGWVIRGMRRVKLAWNVVEITPERQREKLAQL